MPQNLTSDKEIPTSRLSLATELCSLLETSGVFSVSPKGVAAPSPSSPAMESEP